MGTWLHVIGIGPGTGESIGPEAMAVLERADTIITPERYREFASGFSGRTVIWQKEYTSIIPSVMKFRDCDTCVAMLVTGDPTWFSAGSTIAREMPASEVRFHPQVSSFQLASARMCWAIEDTILVSILGAGRPVERLIPHLAPESRIIALASGHSHLEVARIARERGFGNSIMTLLCEMGTDLESHHSASVTEWEGHATRHDIPPYHVICLDCRPAGVSTLTSRAPGLPDSAFCSSRNFTRSEVRSVTVSALLPGPNRVMWDLGTGTGSVAIEWMRLAGSGMVFAIDHKEERIRIARENALRLGVPEIAFMTGDSITSIDSIAHDPDVVFIGGGLSHDLVRRIMARLKPPGRLVANAVTIESEIMLSGFSEEYGGDLVRIEISRASRIGTYRAWKRQMPITQWRYEQ